jgi:Fe-S-cluster-containing dehydrogenase component
MTRYAMTIDLDSCIGCYNCQIACKDEHVGNDFPPIAVSQPTFGHFWMGIEERERRLSPTHIKVVYIPRLCQHCADAACIKTAKNGAAYRRPDGIVIIDPEKAAGQKELVEACPNRAIFWNEEKNLPQKCTFCAHLLDDGWAEPRCVQTCPTSCIHFGDLDDPNSRASRFNQGRNPEALHPELNSGPSVRYVGLPKPHLSGTVIYGDRNECAPNVTVGLTGPSGREALCRTDAFGDFAFADVAMGEHSLRCEAEGYVRYQAKFSITGDIECLGEISLRRAREGS